MPFPGVRLRLHRSVLVLATRVCWCSRQRPSIRRDLKYSISIDKLVLSGVPTVSTGGQGGAMPRKLHLAVAVYGVGGPGQHGLWKDPRVPKNASIDIRYYIKQATIAESALFDAFFVVDSQFINATYPSHYLNRLEPLTLLSAVATHTTNIGLIATASSTYNSPFNLARRLASLDQISNGRAGWNVVTSFDSEVSKNFGQDEHLDYATRYGRALEFVEVARGLWDSYEDDAFPADVEAGVFLDRSKLHALNHVGEHS